VKFCTDWFSWTTRAVRRNKMRPRGARNMRRMKYTLYFGIAPAPKALGREQLERLLPVRFSTEEDALHGAALVIRGGQYPWLIEGPDLRLDAREIGKRCEPILQILRH
jgi:hypothetical protein